MTLGKEECPGMLQWSPFGARYPDAVCSSALDWSEAGYEPVGVLCDADDEFRPKDIPCPFCDPEGFIAYQWGEPDEYTITWINGGDGPAPSEIHFHDGKLLWWTATHPERGEERVLITSIWEEDDE